jgi:uncharacterized protein (UPF0335 family)
MTLQFKLDSLEGLDENTSKLYIEKEGIFYLDVDGHEKNDDKNKIPRSRLNQEIDKRKAAEVELQTIAEDLKKDVPEEMQGLIPDLPAAKLVVWLRSANAKGLFDPKSKESIDSKKPGDKKPIDFETMSPQAIMASGYKR